MITFCFPSGTTKHITVILQPMVTGEMAPGPVTSAEVTEETNTEPVSKFLNLKI